MQCNCNANGNQNKAGVAILIPNKIDFKLKMVKRYKKGHYVMIKRAIHQDQTTVNYASKNRTPKYIKQKLIELKGEMAVMQ